MDGLKINARFMFRPAASAAIGMLFGTLLFPVLPETALIAIAAALLAAMLFAMLKGLRPWMIVFAFAALALLLGHARRLDTPVTGVYTVEGRVCCAPESDESGLCTLTLDRVVIDGRAYSSRLMLTTRSGAPLRYGQTVRAEASLYAPDAGQKSYFDYRRVFCAGSADSLIVTGEAPRASLYGMLLTLRERLSERIDRLFPGGVAAAMLLGDKSGMDASLLGAYRASGLAHLLAVSGLHTSVLAGAFSALFRRRPWLRFAATAVFLVFYCALTACSPSVLRATVMLLFWLLARPLREPPDPVSSLSAAFVFVLFCNPYALLYAGFQLSFLAAYGLALLSPVLFDRFRRFGTNLARALAGTLSVCIATLPAQASLLSGIPLTAALASLFAVPIAPFFLAPGFVLTLLSYVSYPLADALAFLPRAALSAVNGLSTLANGASVFIAAPSVWAVLFYAGSILFVSRLYRRSPKVRLLCSGMCLAASVLLWTVG